MTERERQVRIWQVSARGYDVRQIRAIWRLSFDRGVRGFDTSAIYLNRFSFLLQISHYYHLDRPYVTRVRASFVRGYLINQSVLSKARVIFATRCKQTQPCLNRFYGSINRPRPPSSCVNQPSCPPRSRDEPNAPPPTQSDGTTRSSIAE